MSRRAAMTEVQRKLDNRMRRIRRKRAWRAVLATVPWERVIGRANGRDAMHLTLNGTPVVLTPEPGALCSSVLEYWPETHFIVGLTAAALEGGWRLADRGGPQDEGGEHS